MTPCGCDTNPLPHGCTWVLPWQASALVLRPIQTIHTWRKHGQVGSRRDPETGRWQVCNCEAAARAQATGKRTRRYHETS